MKLFRWEITITIRRVQECPGPKKPKPPTAKTLGEFTMSMLKVEITVPDKTADDVVLTKVHLKIEADGVAAVESDIEVKDPDRTFTVDVPRNALLTMTAVEVDGDGNASEASDESAFKALDTFPPGKPGSFQGRVVGQV